MLYKFLNIIFGWDYIYYEMTDNYDKKRGVSKLIKTPDHRICYWANYKGQDTLFILKKGKDVIWLTCAPEKYFPEEPNEIRHGNETTP